MTSPPTGTYRTVVIDPPWPIVFHDGGMSKRFHPAIGHRRVTPRDHARATVKGGPYDTMSLPDIQAMSLPLPSPPAPGHVLLWATQASMQMAFDVVRAWGLRYRATTTWQKGSGIHTHRIRRDTEFLIYATSGRYETPEAMWPTLIVKRNPPGTPNSAKPASIYGTIRKCFPGPLIDMFARRRHHGFDSWGDQVEAAPWCETLLPEAEFVGGLK